MIFKVKKIRIWSFLFENNWSSQPVNYDKWLTAGYNPLILKPVYEKYDLPNVCTKVYISIVRKANSNQKENKSCFLMSYDFNVTIVFIFVILNTFWVIQLRRLYLFSRIHSRECISITKSI